MRHIILLPLLLALVACANPNARRPPPTPTLAAADSVSLRIAEAANKAATALQTISRVEQTRTPPMPTAFDDVASAPSALQTPTTIRWSGPAEQIAELLAMRAGYSYRTLGSRPPVPVVVNIDAYEQPLVHVLRDVGLQITNQGDLTVDPNRNAIEIRYVAKNSL